MPANEQTPDDAHCSCGAAEVQAKGFDVPHKTECYIELAKDAEAVVDAPVRDLGREQQTITANDVATVSAAQLTGQRRALVDPGPETEFCKIRFVPGLPTPMIEAYNTEGKPSIVQVGRITGKLLNVREVDTNYGIGTALDLELSDPNNELNKLVVGCFASSMLARLIKQVRVGSTIEIARIPSVERWHVYEVYVLD